MLRAQHLQQFARAPVRVRFHAVTKTSGSFGAIAPLRIDSRVVGLVADWVSLASSETRWQSVYRRFNATNGSTLTARRAGAAAATAATAHRVIATHASVGVERSGRLQRPSACTEW